MPLTDICGRAICQRFTICNKRGLHARASARFVRTTERFNAAVEVSCNGLSVDGTSIMDLMMLGAGAGSKILVQASGEEAREVLEAIAELVKSGFDEDNEGASEE